MNLEKKCKKKEERDRDSQAMQSTKPDGLQKASEALDK